MILVMLFQLFEELNSNSNEILFQCIMMSTSYFDNIPENCWLTCYFQPYVTDLYKNERNNSSE